MELLDNHQIEAVLQFLQVPKAPPGASLLEALLAAYVRRIPWESASRIVRRLKTTEIALCPRWPDEFWELAIANGTGGTCFESNYAFFSLLRALGFNGYLTINDMLAHTGCHTAIVIKLDEQKWLVDAGFPVYRPVPFSHYQTARRHTPFHDYTLSPEGSQRVIVQRSRHPKPYMYTLIDLPVSEEDYRSAATADYGSAGLFLDQVIITKVIREQVWRFYSAALPLHIEFYRDDQRIDQPIASHPSSVLAKHFGMDESILHTALAAVNAPLD